MIFNSFDFLIFLPIAFVLFWSLSKLGKNVQNIVILALSVFFYGYWNWKFLGLLLGLTALTFVTGYYIGGEAITKKKKKLLLWLDLIVCLGLLFLFKYYNFFLESFTDVVAFFGGSVLSQPLKIILPVGISFYIFTSLSYVIDVYKGRTERTTDWLAYFSYVTFFPALFSGPIGRSTTQLPQFYKARTFDADNGIKGIQWILWGFFMKLCVADRVGLYVDSVFNNIEMHNGSSILLADIFYTFQLYCDFGGYSLIAMGVGKLFSIDLLPNFNRPYMSTSYTDYWKREHMSLTNWLMDYVYYPMIGDSSRLAWWNACMIITFLISGLWHGAAWTFVLWGLYQGIFLIVDTNTARRRKKFEKKYNLKNNGWWKLCTTILTYVVITLGLIFFRANSVHDAFYGLEQIFINQGKLFTDGATMLYGFIGIAILMTKDFIDEYHPDVSLLANKKTAISIISSAILLCWIIYAGVFDGGQFIYFQF